MLTALRKNAFTDVPPRSREPTDAVAVWPEQRCPVVVAISDDEGNTWPYRRIIEHGEGYIGPWNDINNRRYEYPVMMQDHNGIIHIAYSWGDRSHIKVVSVTEAWILGPKAVKGIENLPGHLCIR